jgi:hypothetical protein
MMLFTVPTKAATPPCCIFARRMIYFEVKSTKPAAEMQQGNMLVAKVDIRQQN